MLGVAAGVEDDQALRRVEDDGVAVGAAVERDCAGNQVIGLCGRGRADEQERKRKQPHR